MKTLEEIQTEIEALKAMKPRVRRTNAFGDNHHDAIDAQLEVLEKRLGNNAIYDRWEPGDDDDLNEDEGRSQSILDEATYAYRWMHGDEDDAPSKNWEELVK